MTKAGLLFRKNANRQLAPSRMSISHIDKGVKTRMEPAWRSDKV
jgi:hypothetical protein